MIKVRARVALVPADHLMALPWPWPFTLIVAVVHTPGLVAGHGHWPLLVVCNATLSIVIHARQDGEGQIRSMYDLYNRFGMNPGNALYRFLGLLFYKHVGTPDVTFRQLYEVRLVRQNLFRPDEW